MPPLSCSVWDTHGMCSCTHSIDKLASASCSCTRSLGGPNLADCDLELYAFDAPLRLHSQVLKLWPSDLKHPYFLSAVLSFDSFKSIGKFTDHYNDRHLDFTYYRRCRQIIRTQSTRIKSRNAKPENVHIVCFPDLRFYFCGETLRFSHYIIQRS